jgi:hypothetical protein
MVNYYYDHHTEQMTPNRPSKKQIIRAHRNLHNFIGSIDGQKNRRFTRY